MKKGAILNRALNNAIAAMGHGDLLVIGDAGYPTRLDNVIAVDLAITKDYPDIITILQLLKEDFIYENCYVAEEQKLYNPLHHEKILNEIDRCAVELVPHAQFMEDYAKRAKVIIRTGSFEPWGNIALVSGVDAPIWFQKEGTIAPDYYEQRASYKE